MAGLLEGKVAIVTGAGKGIGKAIAEAYAGEGATVVVSDIDEGLAKETASRISGASAIACDVRSEEQVKSLVDQTVAQHGGLQIMVPNAGIGRPVPLLGMDYEEWRAVTSVKGDFERLLGFPDGQFDQVIAMKQGRYGTAEEVARMAVFLASDRSSFSNGSPFVLDGGCRASLL